MRLLVFNLATDYSDPVLGFAARWVEAFAGKVSHVNVITMRSGVTPERENVRVYSLGKEKGYSEPRRAARFYKYLGSLLRRGEVDACFSHMSPIFTVMAAPLLKPARIPVITWYAHPSATKLLKLADAVSDRMVTSLRSAFPIPSLKLDVIGQGIDTAFFSPGGAPRDLPMILCAGRLSPVKRHIDLIDAVDLLHRENGAAFTVDLVGGPASLRDESYVRLLRSEVFARGLGDVVTFHGPRTMSDLRNWYRNATVHVNLTPRGFGDKVAWEAMSCGCPCLVANEEFYETAARYWDRLHFKFGNAVELRDRLRWALSLPRAEHQEIGQYLSQQVDRLHSLSRLTDRILLIAERLRSEGRTPTSKK